MGGNEVAIDRPIFLLGPGRSGSTLLNNIITHHRQLGYFISWSSKYPRYSFLSFGALLRSSRLEMRNSRIRFYPGPTEPYTLWKYCFPDFWKICREPCLDTEGATKLRRIIESHLRVQGRSRFLAKLTGPPMFSFLESLFSDARFVWVDRDPRAVSFSYFLRREIDLPAGLSEEEKTEQRLRHAAQRYLGLYDLLQMESRTDYRLLRYEDFIAQPVAQMRQLLEYLELPEDKRLLRITAQWPIKRNSNAAWKRILSPAQQELLEGLLERPLQERGYA